MLEKTSAAEKIVTNLKGLRNHLQPGEQPLVNIPAIWDGGQSEQGQRSMFCDVILTNQRVLGYVFSTFPRERLFLDALTLSNITAISLRQKTFEPIFRELLISDGQRKVYIRATRQKIEQLYEALRTAIEQYAPTTAPAINSEPADAASHAPSSNTPRSAPVYGRQEVRTPFENSPLAITLLFVGGLILEIVGAFLVVQIHSTQAGLPLCGAGFVSVLTAILLRRRSR